MAVGRGATRSETTTEPVGARVSAHWHAVPRVDVAEPPGRGADPIQPRVERVWIDPVSWGLGCLSRHTEIGRKGIWGATQRGARSGSGMRKGCRVAGLGTWELGDRALRACRIIGMPCHGVSVAERQGRGTCPVPLRDHTSPVIADDRKLTANC